MYLYFLWKQKWNISLFYWHVLCFTTFQAEPVSKNNTATALAVLQLGMVKGWQHPPQLITDLMHHLASTLNHTYQTYLDVRWLTGDSRLAKYSKLQRWQWILSSDSYIVYRLLPSVRCRSVFLLLLFLSKLWQLWLLTCLQDSEAKWTGYSGMVNWCSRLRVDEAHRLMSQ